jgi:hypothetical protein
MKKQIKFTTKQIFEAFEILQDTYPEDYDFSKYEDYSSDNCHNESFIEQEDKLYLTWVYSDYDLNENRCWTIDKELLFKICCEIVIKKLSNDISNFETQIETIRDREEDEGESQSKIDAECEVLEENIEEIRNISYFYEEYNSTLK